MSRAIIPSTHFGLPIPGPESVIWAQTLRDYLEQAELKLGTNCNLIITAQNTGGMAARNTLAYIAGENQLKIGQSQSSLWGRLVVQQAMAAGQPVLGRLIGITDLAGLSLSVTLGNTLYHRQTGNGMTTDPSDAVAVISNRSTFLPLGYAFNGGHSGFFNGTLPLQYMPMLMSGAGVQLKPGINDPAASFAETYNTTDGMIRWNISFGAGATETIDLLVPFPVPSDFLQWLNRGDIFAFRTRFKTTGNAALQVLSLIDSGGTERSIAGAAASSIGAFANSEVSHATMHGLGATMTQGKVMYLRLRATGGALASITIESRSLLQYFPRVSWS